jgi:transcriptional regulator with GAF, ATPase, and Fis domain
VSGKGPRIFSETSTARNLDEEISSSSEALLPVLVDVPNVAATDCTVLITGEIGTGMELDVKAIHRLSHRARAVRPRKLCGDSVSADRFRASGPPERRPVPGNATTSRSLSSGRGGTISLDGRVDLSAEAQLARLRVPQETESEPARSEPASESHSIRSDVRLIAATNRDLPTATANGTLRGDLFDWLNGIPIQVPP